MTNAQLIANDPGWIIAVKALFIFVFALLTVLLFIWAERRILGFMQNRLGPNRVGPFGLIQSLADGVKLALKEDIIPAAADKIVFVLAPIISATTCFMSFAVIPITGEVTLFGHKTAMQLTDIPVGRVRLFIEITVLTIGWLLGGTVGLGTILFGSLIGYSVAIWLKIVGKFSKSK